MDVHGLRLQFSQIMIRNLMRFVDSLPGLYALGGVGCLLSKRAQRLGDVAANTIVVRNPKIAHPDLKQLVSGKYNSLRDYPHLVARLRQKVTPQEAGIALQSLLRRDSLSPGHGLSFSSKSLLIFAQLLNFRKRQHTGLPMNNMSATWSISFIMHLSIKRKRSHSRSSKAYYS